ncbi:MAG: hypothetical protein H6909_03830 [Rickettsiaceae bacterium]|nr:hypothetical protein [Rickettsiaceae bacterium]
MLSLKQQVIKFIHKHHNDVIEFPLDDTTPWDEIKNFMLSINNNYQTPLISALIKNDEFTIAKNLLKTEGVYINQPDSYGKIPIDYAQDNPLSSNGLIALLGGNTEDQNMPSGNDSTESNDYEPMASSEDFS